MYIVPVMKQICLVTSHSDKVDLGGIGLQLDFGRNPLQEDYMFTIFLGILLSGSRVEMELPGDALCAKMSSSNNVLRSLA